MGSRLSTTILVLLLVGLAARPANAEGTRSTAFDGTWFVALDCADTEDRSGLVKGYQFAFDAYIVDGRLDGRYGNAGQASSLHLTGEVRDGGVLELRADGISGATEYVVGRAARGTPYVYTMGGSLDATRGEAARREVRPCTARFAKRDGVAR